MKKYPVRFHDEAEEEFLNLDGSLQKEAVKKLEKIAANPDVGKVLGNHEGIDLTGCRSVYFDKKKRRIVYTVENGVVRVFVLAIGIRDKEFVYRVASQRI